MITGITAVDVAIWALLVFVNWMVLVTVVIPLISWIYCLRRHQDFHHPAPAHSDALLWCSKCERTR